MSKRPRKHFNLDDSGDAEIGAQPCEYVSVGLRLEGDPAKIRLLLKRLELVGSTTWPSYCYVNTHPPYGVQVYARVNLNSQQAEALTLYDQLMVAREEVDELSQQLGEKNLECQKLKQELGMVRKPKPGDAVLGGKKYTGGAHPVK